MKEFKCHPKELAGLMWMIGGDGCGDWLMSVLRGPQWVEERGEEEVEVKKDEVGKWQCPANILGLCRGQLKCQPEQEGVKVEAGKPLYERK